MPRAHSKPEAISLIKLCHKKKYNSPIPIKKMRNNPLIKAILWTFLILIITLYIARALNPGELDDVTPGIQCNSELIAKSDILWIIPDFNNIPISNNSEWCNFIKSQNKTLGLHGIYHAYREFDNEILPEELNKAINDFTICTNTSPNIFKAPQLHLSTKNRIFLIKNNLEIKGRFNQLTHKTYHCSNTGVFPNSLIDLF